ncbi:hypothetical protein H9W91_17560 [Streptomyces alfalfae]|uniref:hypothetical protein n=1 Tax=Streptomyces alfalfae TaxID=1642299 RepID=UPI001BA546EE|nr:hypothetical protein [Streptomyces alfalfae]QUI32467.1 hypothetical protein H9W91_17560 [Streptomyces alfalfae]
MKQTRPGQWPVDQPADLDAIEKGTQIVGTPGDDELYLKRSAEKALHEMVLDSIRHDLEQQPSPLTVISAARTWCYRITAAADEIAEAKRRAA